MKKLFANLQDFFKENINASKFKEANNLNAFKNKCQEFFEEQRIKYPTAFKKHNLTLHLKTKYPAPEAQTIFNVF